MEGLPLREKGIITIDKKRVIKLLAQLGFQGSETGEIDDKATGIQLFCRKPDRETAAIAMHEAAMARMSPLPVTTGIALELLAAGVSGGGQRHRAEGRDGTAAGFFLSTSATRPARCSRSPQPSLISSVSMKRA